MSKKTGTKKKQTKQKEKQQGFNDLLIPMLLILCIMPFIVRLALYSCGYAKYPWYSDEDVIMDLYSYYRCYFFEVVAIFTAAVLAFRIGLFPENRKKMKIFIPLAVYAGMILLSTLLSVNMGASFTGNFYQFQGVLVLLGYLVFCLYAYQVMEQEKDYKTMLQEKLQEHGNVKITYKIIKETGPDHNKTFEAEVELNGKELAKGKGKSKKLAEMSAAKKALENL